MFHVQNKRASTRFDLGPLSSKKAHSAEGQKAFGPSLSLAVKYAGPVLFIYLATLIDDLSRKPQWIYHRLNYRASDAE